MDDSNTDDLRQKAVTVVAESRSGGSCTPELDLAEYLSDMGGFDMSEV